MARISRIPHPPGGRFVQMHHWAIKALGKNGAAVLAAVDFFDRAAPQPGTAVVSRNELVVELSGLVGRDAVDAALADLVTRGWLKREERVAAGRNNLIRKIRYSLNAVAVANFLAGTDEENQDAQ